MPLPQSLLAAVLTLLRACIWEAVYKQVRAVWRQTWVSLLILLTMSQVNVVQFSDEISAKFSLQCVEVRIQEARPLGLALRLLQPWLCFRLAPSVSPVTISIGTLNLAYLLRFLD